MIRGLVRRGLVVASAITWLDFSEAEQQRVRDLLQFFSDKGTVDDLGLGAIRDAFSNQLFPGTSVIQTRARYFLFIPWIYAEAQRRWPANVVAKGGDMERKLILALGNGGESDGVIGRDAGVNLKTLPSAIYWGGLHRYGISRMHGRTLRQYGRMVARGLQSPEFEGEVAERAPSFWAETPPAPEGFFKLDTATFTLSSDEADWLAERMLSTEIAPAPRNLLGELLRALRRGDDTALDAEFAWDLQLRDEAPASITDLLHESQRFSCLAQGASLLYNLMLVEAFGKVAEVPEGWIDYRAWMDEWSAHANTIRFAEWCGDTHALWRSLAAAGASVPQSARQFVDGFARIVHTVGTGQIADDESAQELIRNRELQHKKAQARFANKKRLLAYPGYAGTSRMEFRWTLVRRLLADIAEGMETGAHDAVA
jgi:hypothetical protein